MPALRICCRICYPSGMLMRACVAGLLLLLCGTFALAQVHPRDQEPPTIRAEVALVNVIFTAVDKNGRHVPDLKTGDFMVFEDRLPQKVEYFSELGKGSDIPLTIALRNRHQRQCQIETGIRKGNCGRVLSGGPSQGQGSRPHHSV